MESLFRSQNSTSGLEFGPRSVSKSYFETAVALNSDIYELNPFLYLKLIVNEAVSILFLQTFQFILCLKLDNKQMTSVLFDVENHAG